jgi:hypothetical protein
MSGAAQHLMFAVPPTYGLKLADDMTRDELQFVVRQLAGLLADAERLQQLRMASAAGWLGAEKEAAWGNARP